MKARSRPLNVHASPEQNEEDAEAEEEGSEAGEGKLLGDVLLLQGGVGGVANLIARGE